MAFEAQQKAKEFFDDFLDFTSCSGASVPAEERKLRLLLNFIIFFPSFTSFFVALITCKSEETFLE